VLAIPSLRRAAALLTLSLFGCGPPAAVVPLPSLRYQSGHGTPTTAVLFMPGRHSRAGDFAAHGFVRAVEERGLNLELLAVDAHLGYYLEKHYRYLPARVHEDVVLPAMDRGIRQVWLVGTSLGAMGSFAYAKRYPAMVAGVVLLGPYLGEEPIVGELERAGGLAAWTPAGSVGYPYEVRTWRWLKRYTAPDRPPLPELYLGYGERDRFVRADRLLAPALPPDHVLTAPGGEHDWDTWLGLWRRFLACCGDRLEQASAPRDVTPEE
jgi:pimeloyl-ACP methyl ester carboxylesterase